VAQEEKAAKRRASVSPWPFDRHQYSIRLRSRIPSNKPALNLAVEQALKVADQCCDKDDLRTDLEIALREALANAMIHGNSYGQGKRIFVRCYASPSSGILIIVRDQGKGFDPAEIPDPRDAERKHLQHGRGLFLMRELMDHVEYRKGGSEVVIYKAFKKRKPD